MHDASVLSLDANAYPTRKDSTLAIVSIGSASKLIIMPDDRLVSDATRTFGGVGAGLPTEDEVIPVPTNM